MSYPGFFLAIEGIDAAGTTTQTAKVTDALNARHADDDQYPTPPVHKTKEPTDGPIGGTIRTALSDRLDIDSTSLALLFAADRVDHSEQEIMPLLEEGHIVVSDRYYHSSFAYQQTADDLSPDWIRTINEKALSPDLTVFLDISPKESVQRLADERPEAVQEEFEELDQLRTIRKNYHQTLDQLIEEGERILQIDGDQPPETVTEEIIDAIDRVEFFNS